MPLSSGDILGGHYRSEAEIGRGAYGRVYRARDTKLDRPVAIKELARGVDELGSSAFSDYVRRFEREARVQAGFNHPNIVHVYELIQEGADRLYLVMELVDGESLRDLLARRGPLPADEAIRVTADVLAGLAVVHADPRDIVHRDIKPSNVLLTKAGQAKLADFGLAQVGDESMRSGAGQAHPGTAFYMSPEQSSTSDYLYPASDLFGVGCVLFEMLTGVPYKRAQRERKTLQVLRPDAPPWLGEIMTAALAKDPDDRPKDAAEMGRLLARTKAKVEAEARTIAETEERERQEEQRKAEAEAERARLAEQGRRQRTAAKQAKAEVQRKALQEADEQRQAKEAERERREAKQRAHAEAEVAERASWRQEERTVTERERQEVQTHGVARHRQLPWTVIGVATVFVLVLTIWHPWTGRPHVEFTPSPMASQTTTTQYEPRQSPPMTIAPAASVPTQPPAVPQASTSAKPIRIAVVLPTSITDMAFSQSMWDALQAIQVGMGGRSTVEVKYSEYMFMVPDAAAALRDYASQGFDLVLAHSSQYGTSVQEVAKDFPKVTFAWGTAVNTFGMPNVYAYTAAAEQGGYVNGVMAALLTKSKLIGVTGPVEAGDARTYVDGFVQGVASVDPNVNVKRIWTGSFSDVVLMNEAAKTHIAAGADALTGSSQSVVGAIAAAKEKVSVMWFGTQHDQASLAPQNVVASQQYDWNGILTQMISNRKNGKLGGEAFVLEFKNGGLKIIYNPGYQLPSDVKKAAEAAIEGIKNGSIKLNP